MKPCCRSLHTRLTATGSWSGSLKRFALNSNGQMTADEHQASSEQCQNNYSFFYMCCRDCLHATCHYCARNHRHCFVLRFFETKAPIRVWSRGNLKLRPIGCRWRPPLVSHTEMARLDRCLCIKGCTVSGFLSLKEKKFLWIWHRSHKPMMALKWPWPLIIKY